MRGLSFLFALLLLVLSGCEPVTEVDDIALPQGKKLLAVYGVLRPNLDTQLIYVGRTLPLGYGEYMPIDGQQEEDPVEPSPWGDYPVLREAEVVLEDVTTGKRLVVPYSDKKQLFAFLRKDFPLTEGHTFRLEVRSQGLPPVHSEGGIPTGNGLRCGVEKKEFVRVRIEAGTGAKRYFVVYAYNTKQTHGLRTRVVDYEYVATAEGKDGAVEAVFGDNIFGFNENKRLINRVEVYELEAKLYYFLKGASEAKNSSSPFNSPVTVQGNIVGGRGGFGFSRLVLEWKDEE